MRPTGTWGPVGAALLHAAHQGPGTVAELAQRAQVGFKSARYTATRLCQAGELQVVQGGRPQVLAPAVYQPAGPHDALVMLDAAFWGGAAVP